MGTTFSWWSGSALKLSNCRGFAEPNVKTLQITLVIGFIAYVVWNGSHIWNGRQNQTGAFTGITEKPWLKPGYHETADGRSVPGASTPAIATAPAFSRRIGETFKCAHGFLAALTEKDAEKVGELVRAGDKTALYTMALQGRLISIKAGTTVTLEDRDIFNVTESFRVRGNPDTCYASIGGSPVKPAAGGTLSSSPTTKS